MTSDYDKAESIARRGLAIWVTYGDKPQANQHMMNELRTEFGPTVNLTGEARIMVDRRGKGSALVRIADRFHVVVTE